MPKFDPHHPRHPCCLADSIPNISANNIEDVLVSAKSWEETVDILVTNYPESGSAFIPSFVDKNLDIVTAKVLKIKTEDIWRDAVHFYEISMAIK